MKIYAEFRIYYTIYYIEIKRQRYVVRDYDNIELNRYNKFSLQHLEIDRDYRLLYVSR